MIKSLLQMVWEFAKIPLFLFLVFCVVFGFLCLVYGIILYRRGYRFQHGEHHALKKPSFLRSFFYLLPHQFMLDMYARNPEFFTHQGCIIFTGRQGNGKTIAMAQQALAWREEYPKAKCITNFALQGQSRELNDWRLLLDYKNGIQGVIACIDEMQNWFSSNQSKNFPPEMLEVITQNRKNRRVIMGTAQTFNRLSKPIREQATEVRRCTTLFGCLTVVHRVIPELDSEGNVEKWKHRGFYYFVHDEKLRSSYDTWRVIESLSKSGFQPAPVVVQS